MSPLKSVVKPLTNKKKQFLTRREEAQLEEALHLFGTGEASESLDILEELHKHHPDNVQVMDIMLLAYNEIGMDMDAMKTLRRLLETTPHGPMTLAGAAQTYAAAEMPVSSLKILDELAELYPDIDQTNEIAAEIRPGMEELLQQKLEEDDLPEKTSQFLGEIEHLQQLVIADNIEDAAPAARQLVEQYPDYYAALSLIVTIEKESGNIAKAIAGLRRILEILGNDIETLLQLSHLCTLNGEHQAAHVYARELLACQNPDVEWLWFNQFQALALVGDQEKILDLWQSVPCESLGDDSVAAIQHLVAVAAAHQEDEKLAIALWKKCSKVEDNPYATTASENLQQMEQPVGMRHTPWVFSAADWIPNRVLAELRDLMMGSFDTETARKYLDKYPFMEKAISVLLSRSDSMAQGLALFLISSADTPSLYEVLREYVLGPSGSDQFRGLAAALLVNRDELQRDENDTISLWIRGEWQDVKLLKVILVEDEPPQLSKKARRAFGEAFKAAEEHDFPEAQKLFRKVIEMEPDCSLAYVLLTKALANESHFDEAGEVLQRAQQRLPDDLLLRATLASLFAENSMPEKSERLLKPLRQSEVVSSMELRPWIIAEFELARAKQNVDEAKAWLNLLWIYFPSIKQIEGMVERLEKRRVI